MADLQAEYNAKNTFFRKWGVLLILLLFFVLSWGGQFATQLQVEKEQSAMHGQEFMMEEFWPEFWASTFENWQSEWLQLFTQALLVSGMSAYIFRKQDEEHYKTQIMIEDLKTRVEGLRKTKK